MTKKVKVHNIARFDPNRIAIPTANSMYVQTIHCRHDCVAYDTATEELNTLKARVAELETYLSFLRSKDINNYIKNKNLSRGAILWNTWDNRSWIITEEGAVEP